MPGLCRLTFITLICFFGIQAMAAQQQCITVSEAGPVVQLGSSFKLYCVVHNVKEGCKKSIHVDKKEIFHSSVYNSTAIFVNVKKISGNRTYTCKCGCCWEPCGLDLIVGYPPDVPQNLTCTQRGKFGNVTCTWSTGRKTYIRTMSKLWVKTQGRDSSTEAVSFLGSDSVTFPVFPGRPRYSVWVNVSNKLGSVSSPHFNFTLSDIVQPLAPQMFQANCTPRQCLLNWRNEAGVRLQQVKYRKCHGNWRVHPIIESTEASCTISELQPFTVYEFQIRCKLSPSRGLWSDWSSVVTSRTDEEAPLTNLDVWYMEESFGPKQRSLTVLWKELSELQARGSILGYKLKVEDLSEGNVREYVTSSNTGLRVNCSSCTISLTAYNSKGHSPATYITIPPQRAAPPQNVVFQPLDNHTIAIFWQRPATTGTIKGYLVEWFPIHLRGQYLHWRRVGSHHLQANITDDIQPFECYQGAVYALYDEGSGKDDFMNAYSRQSAPTSGPTAYTKILGDSVTVSWSEIPLEHRRGCLRDYTIYLSRTGEEDKQYGPIDALQRQFTIRGLKSGEYTLFMTGRTAAGEGPRGAVVVFLVYSQQDDKEIIMVASLLCLGLMMTICLCHISMVRRVSCFCLRPNTVPDPANSKWAKECTTVKGEITLKLYLNDSTLTEEPSTLEIEEIEERVALAILEEPGGTSASLERTCKIPVMQPSWGTSQDQTVNQDKPVCPYIKSLSHESDKSEQTQLSTLTDITVDYIPSQSLLDMDGEEMEEDLIETDFFPSLQSPFSEPLVVFGGRLTLDAVKIDCSQQLD